MSSLAIVGTGIRGTAQLTPECRSAIVAADIAFYVVPDRLTAAMIGRLASASVDLAALYSPDLPRGSTYEAMVERVLDRVDAGDDVCVVFYGHPGVFVDPGPEMIRQAAARGVSAIMLPGISAADSLYADLGVDPGRDGIQMFSATDFLLRRRTVDDSVPLVLWQMGAIGQECGAGEPERRYLGVLVERLLEIYPPGHGVVMYEAAGIVGHRSRIAEGRVDSLEEVPLARASTLFVPPARSIPVDVDMSARLGLAGN